MGQIILGASLDLKPDIQIPPGATLTYAQETRRRRTFAIISHPDAGKTTLTEKLLLFSGAIQIAGSVKAPQGLAPRHLWTGWKLKSNGVFRWPRP
jgi:hypothetical protein